MKNKSLMFFAAALLIVQLACSFGAQPTAAPQQGQETEPPASAPALSGDPVAIVTQAIQILPTLSYRKTEWFTDSQGSPPDLSQPPDLVAEFTPPNNSHVTMAGVEYITVNGNFYTRDTGGEWQLSAPDAVSQDAAARVAEMLTQAIQSGSILIQSAGSDLVNGVAAQVFSVSGQVDAGGSPTPIAGRVWVGNDGRLLKMEFYPPDNPQAYFDVSLYEYDPNIVIQAPIP